MSIRPGHGPILVVGGGAASAFLAHSLTEHGATLGRTRPVLVAEPAPELGRGVAYGTVDDEHLMNVCRIRLSVDGDGGEDLVGWLGERGIKADSDTYLQRKRYGDYLVDVVDRCRQDLELDHRRSRVESLARTADDGWLATFADGSSLEVGDVVLATGLPVKPTLPCHRPAGHPAVVDDPWRRGAFDGDGIGQVVIAGTGLTMVDAALSLVARHPEVQIVAASRRGLVPRSSRPGLPATIDPDRLPMPGPDGRRLVRQVIALGRSEEDWQAVVDNVRPRANELWRALPYGHQARILRRWFPWWNVHRHRTAPAIGARLDELLETGQLRIVRSRLDGVDDAGGGRATVRFSADGQGPIDADLVVNATGPTEDLAEVRDPLLSGLVRDGELIGGPHRLGVGVDRSGRALGRGGDPRPGLWVLGALRRGTEWETTAVPEIRIQAGVVAERLLDADSTATDDEVEVGRC